jgi:hypothetical protein
LDSQGGTGPSALVLASLNHLFDRIGEQSLVNVSVGLGFLEMGVGVYGDAVLQLAAMPAGLHSLSDFQVSLLGTEYYVIVGGFVKFGGTLFHLWGGVVAVGHY